MAMSRKGLQGSSFSKSAFSFFRQRSCFSNGTKYSGHRSLKETDPETYRIIQNEEVRQREGIELIASENFASKAVKEALGSVMNNKYSEGYPGARYYAGNKHIDENELLCQKRALQVFRLDNEKWGVNVQPLSGSPANFEVYTGVLQPHDRIMGLDLPHGGHLSHGYMSAKKRISATSIFFESLPYRLNEKTGYIDYDKMSELAELFRPKILIAGASAYSREYDYARMRKVADSVGALLLSDIAHISGLIAAEQLKNDPFEYSDIVTTTTHKTLRGPRGGMIFFRKGVKSTSKQGDVLYDLEERINFAVFPALQGGPHNHQIAAVSVALREALEPEFKDYQRQVKKNAAFLAQSMIKKGYTVVSGGTDNHLFLLDLRPQNIDGARVDSLLEECHITLNKNAVPGDTKPMVPGGVRIGTPAMTTRGLKEADFEKVAEFLDRGIRIAIKLNAVGENSKKVKTFQQSLKDPSNPEYESIKKLGDEVISFATQFPLP